MKISDKERLNWLVKHEAAVSFYKGRWFVRGKQSQEVGAFPLCGGPDAKTPRSAIDAAIRADRTSKGRRQPN